MPSSQSSFDPSPRREPLLQALRRAIDELPAPRVVDRIFECADAFVAGAPQHDDMTLVIVRVHTT